MPMSGGAAPKPSMLSWGSVTKFLNVRRLSSPLWCRETQVISGQGPKQLDEGFKDIRQNFHGRYVRLYGACDKHGY